MLRLFLLVGLPLLAQTGIRIGQIQTVPFAEPPAPPDYFTANPPIPSRISVLRAEFETWVEGIPKSYLESVSGGFSQTLRDEGKLTIHRFVRDNIRETYLRYSVLVERREPGIFRMSFQESQVPVPGVTGPRWREISFENYPVPQIVREGENVALYLTAEPQGRRVIDYVRIGLRQMTPRSDPARDIYADDSVFEVTRPRLRVNGLNARVDASAAPVKGARLRIDVPGLGRYTLAFRPPDSSFERVGETSGTTLTFMIAGNVFRVDSSSRIAEAGSGSYTIYGLRDPQWEAPDPRAPAQFTATSNTQ